MKRLLTAGPEHPLVASEDPLSFEGWKWGIRGEVTRQRVLVTLAAGTGQLCGAELESGKWICFLLPTVCSEGQSGRVLLDNI